jgi:hypothetical protein
MLPRGCDRGLPLPGTAVAFSILSQDIDFTKLLLELLDAPNAIRVFGSVAVCHHGRPALTARYDRNRG